MGAAMTIDSSFSTSNEPIFYRLDTKSGVSDTLDTLRRLFPDHLTHIDHFARPIFFTRKKMGIFIATTWIFNVSKCVRMDEFIFI